MKKIRSFVLIVASATFFTGLNTAVAQTQSSVISNERSETIHIIRGGSQAPVKGAVGNFTGDVTVNILFPSNDPLNISGGYVSFVPGARTAWHSHPQGQMLIITSGSGRVQQWGGPIAEVNEGDVVWFPANVKHWHGAMPNQAMTHIALAQIVAGKSVNWMEKVSDDQYVGK